MLNYLRDPNLAELPADKQADAASQKEQECLTVATHGKDVRKSTTLLCVLFIIGLICLGVMIKKSEPKAAVAKTVDTEEQQIQTAIAKLTGVKDEMYKRMDEIVNKFYEFSNVLQVQVSELVKNPFQLENIVNERPKTNGVSEISAEMIWRETVNRKAKDMKLYSVMKSEKGVCCMIDNKILYEGDTIEDFVVKKISSDSVLLNLEGIEITLKLSK